MKPLFFLFGFAVLVSGCGASESELEAQQARLDQKAKALGAVFQGRETQILQGLSVQLAFEADTDLDLYVTGPLLETVYFANLASKSGGELSADVRCDSEGQRLEEVVFVDPLPGKYRIGVDFPERCNSENSPAPYAVSVLYQGQHQQVWGSATLKQFEVIVFEFEL